MDELRETYTEYLADIEKNAIVHETSAYANITSFKEYKIRKSKHLVDKLDELACALYGLSEEEAAFIRGYEAEFRVE